MKRIAIIGATGKVGREMLSILHQRHIPADAIEVYASKRSSGTKLPYGRHTLEVKTLDETSFNTVDVALFSAGTAVSRAFAPIARERGVRVIDNSSAWRMNDGVPLVVPEINADTIGEAPIIANPNCSTIQSVIPLRIIEEIVPVKRVDYTTYQAVSGSGQGGIEELERTLEEGSAQNYEKPIAHNVLPAIDAWQDGNTTKEELKMIDETRKILNSEIEVGATCVRVPVMNAHAVSMRIECSRPVDLEAVEAAFEAASPIKHWPAHTYPTPLDVDGDDAVHTGRLRLDRFNPAIVHVCVVADYIRKGAALNAVQILFSQEDKA